MADARALLRAHRSDNRIKHSHAAYSDAGKLLCKVCHEHIKAESLWDAHTRSPGHQTNLRALQQQTPPTDANPSSKRKLDDVQDEAMEDAAEGDDSEASSRQKRTKTGATEPAKSLPALNTNGTPVREKTISPPILGRRTSNTPGHGVEIAIPSRPATPLARSDSATSTPNITIAVRSPLVSIESPAPGTSAASKANNKILTDALQVPTGASRQGSVSSTAVQPPTPAPERRAPAPAVDDAEWAAFEADLAASNDAEETTTATSQQTPVGTTSSTYADATISAPAMTTAEVEAKSQEEINERRKQLLEAQIAGEKEDAARALEEEFDEMEELEGRVKRLKEKREQLRRASLSGGAAGKPAVGVSAGDKENVEAIAEAVEDEDEESDDDDGEDEWAGFRFRA